MEISEINSVLSSKIDNYNVISFDFFDTLIQRKVEEKSLVKQCVRTFFNHTVIQLDEENFIKEIEQAEVDECFSTEQAGFDKEAKLINIYQRVFNSLKLDKSKLNAFYQTIIEAEKNNFALVKNAISTLSKLKSLDKKIIITSDTYYSANDFARFLSYLKLNTLIDNVYLSSEVSLNKMSGNMFTYLLKQENIDKTDILHIGDNTYSDVSMPASLGLASLCIEHEHFQTEEMKQQVLYDFGYEILAPVLLSFTENLIRNHPENTVFMFLGRDGYMLKEVFDLYNKDDSLVGTYLYINRILANQLTTKKLQRSVISYLSSQFKSEGFWGLVTVFGLNNTLFSKSLSKWLNQQNLNKNTFINAENTKLLLNNEKLKTLFEDDLLQKKNYAEKYLVQYFPVQKNQAITFVDVGWRGSIYKQLSPVYTALSSCYLLGYIGDECLGVDAFISRNNENSAYLNLFVEYRDLIEYFLSESVNNIIGIGENLSAIYLQSSDIKQDIEKQIVQSSIKDYCKKKLNSSSLSEDTSQVLVKFQQFFTHLPKAFHQTLFSLSADVNIQGDSAIKMQTLLPSTVNNESNHKSVKDVQSMIYLYLSFIKDLQSETELVVYGSGSGAEFILPHIKDKCLFIVDINEKIHGNKLINIPIVGFKALSSFNGLILITVLGRKNQIIQTLSHYNLRLRFLEDYL